MIIERVTVYHLKMELASHFETSFGRTFYRHCLLLEVESEGLVGFGECAADFEPGYAYETVGTAWHILKAFILPGMVGKDVQDIEDFEERVAWVKGHRMAKAGFEMALWDLIGKRENKSLCELFGAEKSDVEVGVSVGLQDTTADLVEMVSGYVDQGYGRVKIKIKPGRDVSEARAVRDAYPELPLQVDANSAYDLDTGQDLLPLDELDLLLIEQPLAEDDLWDHSRLQAQFKTPLCLDESILSLRHTRQALEMEACRVINIKPGRVGGLNEARRIHDFCVREGVPVWCGGMLETGVGRASNLALVTLPGFTLPGDISATSRYYTDDITVENFELNPGSTITVPTGPGLGVTLNRDSLKRAAQSEFSLP